MIREAIERYLYRTGNKCISPKAVLFDMDGVLYDSMRFHAKAWYETCMSYKLQCTPEDFYLFEGRTGDSTINKLFQRTFGCDATEEQKKRFINTRLSYLIDIMMGVP